jgi:peptide/nickel transport system ATP-binding protein
MRLHDEKRTAYGGEILFAGQDLLRLAERDMRRLRGKSIAMIFQDPMTSLNPIMRIGEQIAETVRAKENASRAEARARALALLKQVGVTPAEKRYGQYPFELSGGMMQRVMIAIALSCSPKLLIADEPTTALDVTIQAQILDLLRALQKQHNTAVLLVTHNLGVVAEICDRVAVMYAGRIVEEAGAAELFDAPLHPYTIALMRSRPRRGVKKMYAIPGVPPALTKIFRGCAYAERCAQAEDRCRTSPPPVHRAGGTHSVYCFHAAEPPRSGG